LKELSDQELLEKRQKIKSNRIMNAVLIGVLVGIAIYSTVKHSIGFLTFLPIIIAIIAAKSWKNQNDVLEKEIKSRDLK
jgi:hypothetical protein